MGQRLTIWPLDPSALSFVTISDAGGPGSVQRDGAQGAYLVVAADSGIRRNKRARASLLSWRSTRLKRVVSSTSATETLGLSAALAEAQWLRITWRDLLFNDIGRPDWHLEQAPFFVASSSHCSLAEDVSSFLSVVDAKCVLET